MGPRPVLEGDDVLLLVTLALVVASAVLLILGFVQDALGFIYLSMVCAGVAALALFVFARLAKRRGAALVGAGIGPSPYADDQHSGQPPVGDLVGADDPTQGVATVPAPSRTVASDGESGSWYDEEESAEETDATAAWSAAGPGDDDWGDEVVFPIEDYDDLRVAEILPLLSQLDPDELQEVRDRELAGKARATILDRIDDRLSRDAAGPASAVTTAAIPVVEPLGTGEPAASGAPAFGPSGADGGAAPESAPASSRARSSRKATGATGAAKKTPAKKAPAAKKTPAKKAPAAKKSAAAPAPAEAGVAPADAGVAPAEPPARKASPRKVAAAVTEPAPPSTTARRTASTRKPATAPPQPAAGTGAVGGSTEPVQPAEGAQAVEPAQTEPAASIQPSDPMQPVEPIRPAGPSEATGSGQPAEQADAAPPAKAARRTTKKAAGRTAPTKAVGEAAPAKKAGPARRPTKKTE